MLVCPPQHSIELLAGGCYRLRPATGRACSLVVPRLAATYAELALSSRYRTRGWSEERGAAACAQRMRP